MCYFFIFNRVKKNKKYQLSYNPIKALALVHAKFQPINLKNYLDKLV